LIQAENKLIQEHNEKFKDNPFDPLDFSGGGKEIESKKQTIRLPDAGGSDTNLQVEIGKTLTVIMNSQGIDANAAIKAGGMKVVVGKNGVLSVNGVPTDLQAIGISRDALKVLSFKLKADKSGNLAWQVTGKLFGGGAKIKLKGTLELNPMNGILGPSLKRMKETSAGEI